MRLLSALKSLIGLGSGANRPAAALSVTTDAPEPAELPLAAGPLPFVTEQTDEVDRLTYLLSFNVARTDYAILPPHTDVLTAINQTVANGNINDTHFPRMPTLLPKLMRALNSDDTSHRDIVRLILKDPALTGNVLKRANSAYYGVGRNPVESIDRAVVLLGMEGLRAPVAAAVMQPVFRMPAGFFDQFAPVTWEQAQRTAMAAEQHARLDGKVDTFVAYLLGLMTGMARMVMFRLTLEKYREANGLMPRSEVFIRAMRDHNFSMMKLIAQNWGLSESFVEAIEAQQEQQSPPFMSPLARTLYYAQLTGALGLLCHHQRYESAYAHDLLILQGLTPDESAALMQAACAAVQ